MKRNNFSILDVFEGYEAGPVLRERTPNLNRTVSYAEDSEAESLEAQDLNYDDDSLDPDTAGKFAKKIARIAPSEVPVKAAQPRNSFTSPLAQNRLRKRALGLTDIPAASTPGNQAFRERDEYGDEDFEASFTTGFGGYSELSNFLESEGVHPTNIKRKDNTYNNQLYGDEKMKRKELGSLATHLESLGHRSASKRVMSLFRYAQEPAGRASFDALLSERMPKLFPFADSARKEPLALFISSLTDQKATDIISSVTGGMAGGVGAATGFTVTMPTGLLAPLFGLAAGIASSQGAKYLTKKVMDLGRIGTDEDRMLAALYYGNIGKNTQVGDGKTVKDYVYSELSGNDLKIAQYILQKKNISTQPTADSATSANQSASPGTETVAVIHPPGSILREGEYSYEVVSGKEVKVTLSDGRTLTWTPKTAGNEKWNTFAGNLNRLTPTEQAPGGAPTEQPTVAPTADTGGDANRQRPRGDSGVARSGTGSVSGNDFHIAPADDGQTFVAVHKGNGKLYYLTRTDTGYSGAPIDDRDRTDFGPGYLTRSEQRRLLSSVRSSGESGDRLKAFRRIISGQRMGERGGVLGTRRSRARGDRRQAKGVGSL